MAGKERLSARRCESAEAAGAGATFGCAFGVEDLVDHLVTATATRPRRAAGADALAARSAAAYRGANVTIRDPFAVADDHVERSETGRKRPATTRG
jgi:hypothetical protein